jgi:hypothetical protein
MLKPHLPSLRQRIDIVVVGKLSNAMRILAGRQYAQPILRMHLKEAFVVKKLSELFYYSSKFFRVNVWVKRGMQRMLHVVNFVLK